MVIIEPKSVRGSVVRPEEPVYFVEYRLKENERTSPWLHVIMASCIERQCT